MVISWRRAFCTTITKDRELKVEVQSKDNTQEEQQECSKTSKSSNSSSNQNSPRISSKLGFFSNSSTPRCFSSQPLSSLRIRTTSTTTTTTPSSSVSNSPKLQSSTTTLKKWKSPRFFNLSNNNTNKNQPTPPSPKSPSPCSLIKASLRLSKGSSSTTRCGICLQRVQSGQGTAIFTAECTHVFHVSCVAAYVKRQNLLLCSVCNTKWSQQQQLLPPETITREDTNHNPNCIKKSRNLRFYNDDEPLMSPWPGSSFIPIPESEENEVVEEITEFRGFFVDPVSVANATKKVEVSLLPESAVVAIGRGYETHVAVLRMKVPRCGVASRRAPVDVVALLDVSDVKSMVVMKRAMKLVVSSLNSYDRLSIVAFCSTSKRLLPLRRMTADGRRSARGVMETIVHSTSIESKGSVMSFNDALKKAVKVIEDRRQKNPVARIIVISDGIDHAYLNRSNDLVVSSHFSHLEIPIHYINLRPISGNSHLHFEDSLMKRIGGLLGVAVHDFTLQIGFVSGSELAEITAVYSLTGQPSVLKPELIRMGDLYFEDDRELLVEIKVPASLTGSQRVLSVRWSFRDATSQESVFSKDVGLLLPRALTARSGNPSIQRLRNLHISTRAVAESRRLVEHGDFSGACHLLSSARALLMQKLQPQLSDGNIDLVHRDYVKGLEAEIAELNRIRREVIVQPRDMSRGRCQAPEQLTPASAWRTAEKLAKVAIMRKHMNRVSDLHGFENARF